MASRARELPLLQLGVLALAPVVGVLAAVQPTAAVVIAGGAIIAYAVFADLAIGFAILVFVSFLAILPTSGNLSPAKVIGLLIALAWLARISIGERGDHDFLADHPQIAWLLLAFVAWNALTLVWATATGPGVTGLERYVPNILLIPIASTALRNQRDLRLVLATIAVGAIVAAGYGILKPPDPSLLDRATGTIGDPNEFAAVMCAGLAVGAGLALARGCSPLLRLAGMAAIPFCALGVFLSVSRGGLIALALMLLAATVAAGRWRLAAIVTLLSVAFAGVFYFTQLAPLPARERIVTANGGSGRSDLWKVGMREFRAHPVGGVGLGNYPTVSSKYVLQPGSFQRSDLIFAATPLPPHNAYLGVLSETGVPGLLLFGAVILACLRCALRAAALAERRRNLPMEAFARTLFLALVGMLAAEFFISDTYSKLLWALLGLAPATLAIIRAEGDTPAS